MFNSSLIKNIFIMVCGVFLAIWLGMSLVTEQSETLIKIAAAVLLILSILLGQKIWLLFIFLASLEVPLLRGFSTDQFGQFLFLSFSLLIFLTRRLRMHWHFNELDLWRLLLALSIVQVYFRHPTGLNIFGADTVGGRPYFLSALVLVAGFVLGKYQVQAKELKWAIGLSALGSLLGGPLKALRGGGATNGIEGMETVGTGLNGGNGGRFMAIIPYSIFLSQFIAAKINPLKAICHFLWLPLVLLSVMLAAASGFRNAIATIGLIYLIGIFYRGGFLHVLLASLFGAFGLVLLALINLNFPLPGTIQRALSPLPGTWEERYVDAGDESTEWRVEMWKEALLTDRWIENKILGDGLGFTREQLEMMNSITRGNQQGTSGLSFQQESLMISGSYHSGPVQTIRATGYVGLFILLASMTRLAVHAHREVIRCKGTEWYPWVMFAMIPIIITPIFFVFVFGEFTAGVSFVFFNSGIVQLLQNNLPLPAYRKTSGI